MASTGTIVSLVALAILIIGFITFLILYLNERSRVGSLNDDIKTCNTASDDLKDQLALENTQLDQCEIISNQASSSTSDNFLVDTTGFDRALFLRNNLTDQNDVSLSVCNFPSITPRFVVNNSTYQTCNFAYNNQGNPRCNTAPGKTGFETCSNTIVNGKLTIDPYTFVGYSDGDGEPNCKYWKVLNPSKLQYSLFTLNDSSIWQQIYFGNVEKYTSGDVSVNAGNLIGNSCIPIGAIVRVNITYNSKKYDYVFPGVDQNFVITLWENITTGIPTVTIGLNKESVKNG